ncbi:MAG: HD-GYP domain-containing protein [Bacillota bacterium]
MNKIDIILDFLQIKNNYTYNHSLQVGKISYAIADEMNLDYQTKEDIKIAGLLHDIGKIYIPNEVLMKPLKLDDLEMELIKQHSYKGYELLKKYEFKEPIITYVLQHHERLNGTGYPNGLKGDELLLGSKIIGIADTISAMLSDRPYKAGLSINEIKKILNSEKNLFDPEIFKLAFDIIREDLLHKKIVVLKSHKEILAV